MIVVKSERSEGLMVLAHGKALIVKITRLRILAFSSLAAIIASCSSAQTVTPYQAGPSATIEAAASTIPAVPSSNTAGLPDAPDSGGQQSQQAPAQTQTQNTTTQQQPAGEPSLQDLGITPNQTQGNAKQQALLDKRTHMLKVHQTLGLITTIPMAAALITGPMVKAKGKNGEPITEPSDANLDFHIALGGLTTGLYWTAASYAIFAPKVPGVKKRGAIRFHEALAFIHGPGMVLTPVLGIMAYKQENAGEKVHGIASAHGPVAFTTAAAYGAAIIAVSWPIHLKF